MVKEVSCIHAGFEDCAFLVRSENETELIEFVQRHAEETHGVSVSREHVERIAKDV
ncbi:DUF1059 domain-containing protein [Haloprofundus salilacus]|uniref:DUF1059 domain-containing protein n=1 Tax=Haloprofundus salilacus TaxID=2876190 RepID=UPI001CCC5AB6|nr:DUF1059 domain-containing protein [Haloprofundus salilacus]